MCPVLTKWWSIHFWWSISDRPFSQPGDPSIVATSHIRLITLVDCSKKQKNVYPQGLSIVTPWLSQPVLTLFGTGESYGHATTISMLPEGVLLEIFDFYKENDDPDDPIWDWHLLVHVCQIWRQVVFLSPLRLNLRILCTSSTPFRKDLGIWPVLDVNSLADDWRHRPSCPRCSEVLQTCTLNCIVSQMCHTCVRSASSVFSCDTLSVFMCFMCCGHVRMCAQCVKCVTSVCTCVPLTCVVCPMCFATYIVCPMCFADIYSVPGVLSCVALYVALCCHVCLQCLHVCLHYSTYWFKCVGLGWADWCMIWCHMCVAMIQKVSKFVVYLYSSYMAWWRTSVNVTSFTSFPHLSWVLSSTRAHLLSLAGFEITPLSP